MVARPTSAGEDWVGIALEVTSFVCAQFADRSLDLPMNDEFGVKRGLQSELVVGTISRPREGGQPSKVLAVNP